LGIGLKDAFAGEEVLVRGNDFGEEQLFAEGEQPLFEDMDDAFFKKMRDMRNEIDLLRGDATHAEIEFRKALDAGFDPEQAAKIKEQVELLDGLKQMEDDKRQAELDAKREKPGGEFRDLTAGAGAFQKGSLEAVSAVASAANNSQAEQVKQLQEANAQLAQAVDLLRGIERGNGNGVQLMAGSLS
jgi:hypothetical protein